MKTKENENDFMLPTCETGIEKMTHKIENDNVVVEHIIAGSYGKDEDKELKMIVMDENVSYEIWKDRKFVRSFKTRIPAIDFYNKL